MHDLGSAQVPTARLPAVTQGSTRGLTEEGSFVEKHQDANLHPTRAKPYPSPQGTQPTRSAAIHGGLPQVAPAHCQNKPPSVILSEAEGSLVLPQPSSESLIHRPQPHPCSGSVTLGSW
jgi:hypothetical protein